MRFTRATALVSLVGTIVITASMQQNAVFAAGSLPIIQRGADIPKEDPPPETFVVFDAGFAPSISNEVTRGTMRGISMSSFGWRGSSEFTLIDMKMAAELEYKRYAYMPVQGFTALDGSLSAHVNAQVHPQKIYAGLGYVSITNNYGFPRLGGLGVGVGKLPMLDRKFSVSGNFWFYPNVKGVCGVQVCTAGPLIFAYKTFDYDLGATYTLRSRLFLNAGYGGDSMRAKASAPSDISHGGAHAGLGLRL